MSIGTFIRVCIAVLFIISPIVLCIFVNPCCGFLIVLNGIFLPILAVWDRECNCNNCFLSSRCSSYKRFKMIVNVLKFLGFDSKKLDAIEYPKDDGGFEDSYKDIFKFVMDKYNH